MFHAAAPLARSAIRFHSPARFALLDDKIESAPGFPAPPGSDYSVT